MAPLGRFRQATGRRAIRSYGGVVGLGTSSTDIRHKAGAMRKNHRSAMARADNTKKPPGEPEGHIGKMAGRKGLEPSAYGVTGRRYNHLNYRPV